MRINPSYLEGLTDIQVETQRNKGYGNSVPEKITKSVAVIFKDNILTLFNAYNLTIGVALALVGAYSNMAYLAIIVLNISIGIFQELKAKKLVENLSLLSMPKAEVIRQGVKTQIAIEALVLDDIILLDMGKQVCADALVVYGVVEVNESLLTGETDAVLKKAGDLLLSGSFIISGKCHAKVENVGLDNYALKIAHEAKAHKAVFSELLRSMRRVTKITSFLIIPLGILLFAQAYFIRQDVLNISVVATAAALLGMLPKGLMLLISISLATGVVKLAKKDVLVQELFSLESLAHVDMLCLDKTGTITEGKMTVDKIHLINEDVLGQKVEAVMQQFLGAVDDNNATFTALENHFGRETPKNIQATIPFSSERKWSSASIEGLGTIILGAPERFDTAALPENVMAEIAKGMRVLVIGHSHNIIETTTLPANLTPLLAISLTDPIRKNAKQTLDFFRDEGVHVKIISGDNPQAVSSIAKKAGFANYDSFVDLSKVESESEVRLAATTYDIFGRVSPQQKKILVSALKQAGHTVAMTGDGVNDVLALKEADCSIAMAEGSDAARQVAQLVLLNSDFASLPAVVMEGRRVVNNVTKLASIFFVKTIYSVLLAILCLFTFTAFPFIPIQITLIDLAIEGYPSFFMSFEPDSRRLRGRFLPNVMKKALPNSLTITLNIVIIMLVGLWLNLDQLNIVTVMYYMIGFVSILAVIKASLPFNKLRLFLSGTVFIGFYTAVILFRGLLHITIPRGDALMLFLAIACFSVIMERIFTYVVLLSMNKKYFKN
ncbi:MAG: HAD-IC family P-type ATPase [Culicoidibacterales bacterium]